jgi:hypothetical protein
VNVTSLFIDQFATKFEQEFSNKLFASGTVFFKDIIGNDNDPTGSLM